MEMIMLRVCCGCDDVMTTTKPHALLCLCEGHMASPQQDARWSLRRMVGLIKEIKKYSQYVYFIEYTKN